MTLHFILRSLDWPGLYARILFVDLSSVFNTIVPAFLRDRLSKLNLSDSACSDFLTDRKHLIKLGHMSHLALAPLKVVSIVLRPSLSMRTNAPPIVSWLNSWSLWMTPPSLDFSLTVMSLPADGRSTGWYPDAANLVLNASKADLKKKKCNPTFPGEAFCFYWTISGVLNIIRVPPTLTLQSAIIQLQDKERSHSVCGLPREAREEKRGWKLVANKAFPECIRSPAWCL